MLSLSANYANQIKRTDETDRVIDTKTKYISTEN